MYFDVKMRRLSFFQMKYNVHNITTLKKIEKWKYNSRINWDIVCTFVIIFALFSIQLLFFSTLNSTSWKIVDFNNIRKRKMQKLLWKRDINSRYWVSTHVIEWEIVYKIKIIFIFAFCINDVDRIYHLFCYDCFVIVLICIELFIN